MLNNHKKITLSDLIDIDFLQELQDNFAETMGVASLTVDDNGPITKTSNFTDFCTNHIRANKLGAQRCNKCDIEGGQLAVEKGESVIYTCHAGLTHFVVPIIVKGKHLASILGGQIATAKPDEKHFQNIAVELGITEKNKYIEDLRKIKVVPEESIKVAVKLLSLVVNSISIIAHKNYELIEKNEREDLSREITEKIRSSLNIDEVLTFICEETAKVFNVQRVTIPNYPDKSNYEKFLIKKEYVTSIEVKKYPNNDDAAKTAAYWGEKLMETQEVITFDDIEKSNTPSFFKNVYSTIGVKASMGTAIRKGEEVWGAIVLSDCNNARHWTSEEKTLLKTIANQVFIAINQAELYQNAKQTAERERILRDVSSRIRNSLDFKKIKHEIVTQLGELFNADRVIIAYYDYKVNNYVITDESEYRSSDNVKTFVGVDFTGIPGFSEFVRNIHFQGKDIIFNDLEKYLDENNFRNTGVETFYRNFGYTSSAAINMFYENTFIGDLVITFENKRDFSDEEINFLKTVSDQAGVAFHQAELYEKEKKSAQREAILRKITNKMRNSLDIKQIQYQIVNQIGEYFNASGVRVADYDYELGDYVVSEEAEYKISDEMKTMVGLNFKSIPGFTEHIRDVHLGGENIIFNDLENYLDEKNLRGTGVENFYRDYGYISSAAINIYYKDTYLGDFVINFEHVRDFTEEEISFLKTLADQAGVAFHQAELYKKEKKTAEKESLLRGITKTIRKSLNFDETKKRIVDIIGKTLQADRCFIIEYNKANDKFLIVNEEYLSSDNILSYKGVDFNEHIPSLVAEFKKGTRFIVNKCGEKGNIQIEEFEDVKNAVEKYKLNSVLVFPLFYADEFLGDLVLHYVEKQHEINEDELNFLDLIADQIALALYQSKLYQKVQLQAERERISRNIIEILRSTLDKKMIEHLFVKNIGKYFNADRVFFSEFDKKTNEYLPVDEKSEYLSSPEEKSFARLDLSNKDFGGHIQPFFEKRELIIPNWERYIEKNPKTPELIALYKDANTKSSYSFPVLYEGRTIGYFCIEFTHKNNEFMDEDINRLRSICAQAGIALYHAELYLKAQEALQSRGELITKFKNGIEKPVEEILKTSRVLSELEVERDKQKEYLNNIINSCNQLLELTKDCGLNGTSI